MRLRLLTLLLFPLLLAGCATVSTSTAESPAEQAARSLFADGKFAESAQAWQIVAQTARSPARDRAFVQAAEAFERAGNGAAAKQALAQSNRRKLSGDDAFRHDLLSAQYLIEAGQGAAAVALLNQDRASVPAAEAARWHRLRAKAFEATGQTFDVAIELAALTVGQPPRERASALRNLERLLAGVDANTLSTRSAGLAANDPLYPLAARELSKRGLSLPHPLDRSAQIRTQAFPPADSDGYRPPSQLAVLLPATGTLAAAGAAVRDGLLTGYYGETRRRPLIKFYDTAGTAAGAQKAAAQAATDGAQMIIGPLSREEVSAVFSQGDAGLPVIALNRGTDAPPAGSSSFALLPDDEGLFAADRLVGRGQLKVLVFTQRDDSVQRALVAFREQLRARGGEIVGEIAIDETTTDVVALMQPFLAAGRTPPTAVFMPLRPAQARVVAAQLKLSPLAALPRVSTSVIVGGGSTRLDDVLDGIEYPEVPWLLGSRGGYPEAGSLSGKLNSASGASQRLFAFGLDAWKLTAYLDRFGTDAGYTLPGATGDLRLDGFGVIQREPNWAVISNGRPRAAPAR
jgi:uncharacterized protein